MRSLRFGAVVVLSALSSSCWFNKTHVVFTPPPPQAQPRIPTEIARLPQPPMIAGNPNVPPAVAESFPNIAPPAPPPRRVATPPPAHTTPPPAPAPDQPAPPKLGPLFTPDQRREYNRQLDESLDRVRHALEILNGKNLTPDQADTRNKISTFQKQAEQYRDQDLVSAMNLAHRADLLAQDLLARVPQ